MEAWSRRKKYRARSAAGNTARWGTKNSQPVDVVDVTDPSRMPDGILGNSRDSEGEEEREEKSSYCTVLVAAAAVEASVRSEQAASKPVEPSEGYSAEFEAFWQVYPRKEGKGAAFKAFRIAKRRAAVQRLMDGATAYAKRRKGQDPHYTKHAATWLNADGWNDEPAPEPPGKPKGKFSHMPGYVPMGPSGF